LSKKKSKKIICAGSWESVQRLYDPESCKKGKRGLNQARIGMKKKRRNSVIRENNNYKLNKDEIVKKVIGYKRGNRLQEMLSLVR